MTISQLKPSQHVQGRWLAVLSDGSILRIGENEVVSFSLYTGKELSPEELQALKDAAQTGAWKEKAMAALSRKPMSRHELEAKLAQWEADEESSAAICDRLEELGLLDDGRYAELVVRHYSAKGYGQRRLRDELYRRGVPRELWEEALAQAEDPAQAIDAFLDRKLGDAPPDAAQRKRLADALARRGYSWGDIADAMRRRETSCWE